MPRNAIQETLGIRFTTYRKGISMVLFILALLLSIFWNLFTIELAGQQIFRWIYPILLFIIGLQIWNKQI